MGSFVRTVDEWIGKHDDSSPPARVKLRVFAEFNGKCAHCTLKIERKLRPAYDHCTALVNGGGNRESNLQLLCVPCHAIKTGADVKDKSDTNRIKAKHIGLKKPRTMTRWRKFDGSIVEAKRKR